MKFGQPNHYYKILEEAEQHITSFELSKKLKELGVKQESEFYWVNYQGYPGLEYGAELEYKGKLTFAAFKAEELGNTVTELLEKDKQSDTG